MVAIASQTRRRRTFAQVRDLLELQRRKQLRAAMRCCHCAASNGQFFLGSAKGLQFAIAAVEEAMREEEPPCCEFPPVTISIVTEPLHIERDALDHAENLARVAAEKSKPSPWRRRVLTVLAAAGVAASVVVPMLLEWRK